MLMRDGTEVDDRRLGRLIQFDERSRNFRASEVLPESFRSKTWYLNERNDQGPDGACVGFAVGHRLAARPLELSNVDYDLSFSIYREAQKLDPWAGENYEGTSVLAGVKAAQARGHLSEYRWCFSVDEIIRAIAHEGPVLVGTWWDHNMFKPRPSGLLEMGGGHAGGHAYILRGVTMKPRLRGEVVSEPVLRLTNSWGSGWGIKGEAFIKVSDYEQYLMPDSDAVLISEVRKRK